MNSDAVKMMFCPPDKRNSLLGVYIDSEFFSKNDIGKMSISETKMLMGMCETMKDIKRVLSWKRKDDVFGVLDSYVNNLEISMNYKPYKAK